MLSAYRVAAIRAAEESAAAAADWDALMQRAAAALADEIAALVPADETLLVLVGPGNNGGDALFAAARLAERGYRVEAAILEPSAVHAAGLATATAHGVRRVAGPDGHGYVVDGLFGIGARPGLSGLAADWAERVGLDDAFVIAVDVPSGIGVDEGVRPGPAFRADVTVTFGAAKPGVLIGPGGLFSGRVIVRDIGMADDLNEPACEALQVGDGGRFRALIPESTAHKYTRGVVGVAAGSADYAGAAHLCVAGAQAGPAGMVRFAGGPELSGRVVDRAPEVVAADGRVQSWVVGSGGVDDPAPLRRALADETPTVVDAAALAWLPDRLRPDVLLTPHAGELARMLDVPREQVESDPLKHADEAVRRWNATVLLKGPRTLVVAPDGRVRVNLSGSGWLGTAGAGDVLAGFIGSLLAAGLDALEAGSLGAFLHGVAGQRAAAAGPFPASRVAGELSSVLGDFLAGRLREPTL